MSYPTSNLALADGRASDTITQRRNKSARFIDPPANAGGTDLITSRQANVALHLGGTRLRGGRGSL